MLALAPAGALASGSAYVASGSGTTSQYDVGADGTLSPKTPATVPSGNGSISVALAPDGESAYVARSGGGVAQYDVGAGGVLSPKSPPTAPTGSTPFGIAVAPDGESAYVTNFGANGAGQYTVSRYGIDSSGLLSQSPATLAATAQPIGPAISPDGSTLYVANYAADTVSVYDTASGAGIGTFQAGDEAVAVAVAPDGDSIYVANQAGDSVSQYDIGSPPDSPLTPKTPATVPAGVDPRAIAVAPDGESAYVANQGGTISQYDIAESGALSAKSPATVPAGSGSHGIAVAPDGESAYVTNANFTSAPEANTVSQYDVDSSGLLTPKDPATVATGASAFAIAITPNQAPVAAFSASTSAPQTVAFDASGSSDTDGAIARYDWDFGDGATLPDGGPTHTHTYADPGTYTARLTVTDELGCSTARVFTGQTAYCNGGPVATTTRTIDADAPETTITKRPADRTGKSRVTFKFISDEPGSTFECKIDREPYKSCDSPKSFKVGKGKHKFAVRVIDSAGNIDPKPAKDRFETR